MTTPRTALVTGAASGIGAATARELARQGYHVACLDKDADGVRRIAAELGEGHHALVADVADEPAVIATVAEAVALLGRLDALVTSAGAADTTPFMYLDAAMFRRMYDDNVVGTFLCIREAAKHMEPGARICTIASVAGIRGGGLFGTAAYAASKGAVLALTKNAARALAERGIAVNTVAPGATDTPMIRHLLENPEHRKRVESTSALNRTAQPGEMARTIAFLLSPDASYIDGATIVADGGLCMY